MKRILSLLFILLLSFSIVSFSYVSGTTINLNEADDNNSEENSKADSENEGIDSIPAISKDVLSTTIENEYTKNGNDDMNVTTGVETNPKEIDQYSEDVETAATVKALKKKPDEAQETTGAATENVGNDNLGLTCRSAVLIEGSTGQILYDRDKDLKMEPASITKIMTLILIFEALDSGKITLEDQVSVSEHAASMGGSQVYLEPYETQTVDTMIKCIAIASANDASVAMAEYVAGSEQEFVAKMNEKAKSLGMNNTNFENCCGLDNDTTNHVSTAYDVALMSRELITKHPQIAKYSTTWMDTFTHTTKKGESEFGLTNTNKLVRTYKGITGLKTGSTSKAKFCLSATAKRNDMDLIAVVMSAPEPKARFKEAAMLLDYGFANVSLYKDDNKDLMLDPIEVKNGIEDTVNGVVKQPFSYVCLIGKDPSAIKKEVTVLDGVEAPIEENAPIGKVTYYLDGEKIGEVPIVADKSIRKAKFSDSFVRILKKFFNIE